MSKMIKMWRATIFGVTLQECQLLKKGSVNDLKWFFVDRIGNSVAGNEKFIDKYHGWFYSKTDADKFVQKLKKQEIQAKFDRLHKDSTE